LKERVELIMPPGELGILEISKTNAPHESGISQNKQPPEKSSSLFKGRIFFFPTPSNFLSSWERRKMKKMMRGFENFNGCPFCEGNIFALGNVPSQSIKNFLPALFTSPSPQQLMY
jgi:hypothetical protein